MRRSAALARSAFCEVVRAGNAILFTGAGFSAGAINRAGNALPTTDDMRRDLWRLAIGKGALDESSLQDLYDVARKRCPRRLTQYLRRQLGVVRCASHHAAWLSWPWRRIYTLNVDDLETCVQRCARLPKRLRTVTHAGAVSRGDAVDVIHLNGHVRDGGDGLTFSTLQYAARLVGGDHMYEMLVDDIMRRPFVFVGTTLDEVVLWQQLELKQRGRPRSAPLHPSYLITRTLPRARLLLLADLGVRWLANTMEDVATWFEQEPE
jgi:hypothetical protein